MRFIMELILLGIALSVFMLQHRLKRRMRIEASKLIYWTTLLFVGITFNSILYSTYPNHYNLVGYFNISTLIVIAVVIVGSTVLQFMAPSTSLYKWLQKLKDKKWKGKEEVTLQAIEDDEQTPDEYVRELHFETFLETLCLLATVSVLILEGCTIFFGTSVVEFTTLIGLQGISILFMMLTIPISIRQIIFYLYSLRHLKDKYHLVDVEVQFHQKLKKNNTKLR